jgi:hypothetical protein
VKSGLPVRAIDGILEAVGWGDRLDDSQSADPFTIQNLDARSLAKRGQIFVALTGPATGHALSIYAVRSRPPYEVIWGASELLESGSCPAVTFATESLLGEATASISKRKHIIVRIPSRNDVANADGESTPYLLVATYDWDGKTYQLLSERKFEPYENYVTNGTGILLKCTESARKSPPK